MTVSRTSKLLSQLDQHFGKCAVLAAAGVGVGAVATPQVAEAAIVQVTPGAPIVIPDDLDGLYMNVVTGAGGAVPPAGWDINPYTAGTPGTGAMNLWGPTANTWYNPQGVIGGNYNLPIGTVIGGPATAFFRPGGGTNVGPQMNTNSDLNCLGFRFTNEVTGGNHFGWIRLQVGATASDRAIVTYAYDDVPDTPIACGVPEPSSLGLLALGAVGLISRRRRA